MDVAFGNLTGNRMIGIACGGSVTIGGSMKITCRNMSPGHSVTAVKLLGPGKVTFNELEANLGGGYNCEGEPTGGEITIFEATHGNVTIEGKKMDVNINAAPGQVASVFVAHDEAEMVVNVTEQKYAFGELKTTENEATKKKSK